MCGRYYRKGDKQKIVEAFHAHLVDDGTPSPPWDYNIAPTIQPIIRNNRDTGERELVSLRWGLIPFNLFGRAYGLPEAISGMNSNWLRGYGNPPPRTVIAVGFTYDKLDRIFASCTWAASLPRPYGIVNETIGNPSEVWVCRDVRGGWPAFWQHFQSYG